MCRLAEQQGSLAPLEDRKSSRVGGCWLGSGPREVMSVSP
jgi:hypothetical protein